MLVMLVQALLLPPPLLLLLPCLPRPLHVILRELPMAVQSC